MMYKHVISFVTDIDECSQGTTECNQDCINMNGSYNCSCYDGYEPHLDNTTLCVGMQFNIVFSDRIIRLQNECYNFYNTTLAGGGTPVW